jgi:hypothetical protein
MMDRIRTTLIEFVALFGANEAVVVEKDIAIA